MKISLLLGILRASAVKAVLINPADGKAVLTKRHSAECDACGFAVLEAKKALATLPQSTLEDFGVSGWLATLQQGCSEDDGCVPLLSSPRGKALAGFLADIAEEGEEASERGLETSAFQTEMCSSVAEACPKHHPFASVRSVRFTIEDGNPTENGKFFEDVGFYRRGSSQAGMLPNAPALVLPPGHSHTIFEEEGTVLKAGFAFRLLPVEDFDCPQGFAEGVCEVPCTEEYAAEAISALELTEKQEEQESKKSKTKKKNKKTKVAAVVKESEMKRRQLEDQKATAVGSAKRCLPAEWMCEAMEECSTVSVSTTTQGVHFGKLKKLGGGGWESLTATDLFLDDDLRQEYIVRRNPNFNPNLPRMISDPTATTPDGWDEEEDGVWVAPLVSNAPALRSNPRFLVYKKHSEAGRTPGPPPAPPQHVTDAAGWSWNSQDGSSSSSSSGGGGGGVGAGPSSAAPAAGGPAVKMTGKKKKKPKAKGGSGKRTKNSEL